MLQHQQSVARTAPSRARAQAPIVCQAKPCIGQASEPSKAERVGWAFPGTALRVAGAAALAASALLVTPAASFADLNRFEEAAGEIPGTGVSECVPCSCMANEGAACQPCWPHTYMYQTDCITPSKARHPSNGHATRCDAVHSAWRHGKPHTDDADLPWAPRCNVVLVHPTPPPRMPSGKLGAVQCTCMHHAPSPCTMAMARSSAQQAVCQEARPIPTALCLHAGNHAHGLLHGMHGRRRV